MVFVIESLLAGNFARWQADLIESKHFYAASSKSCSEFPVLLLQQSRKFASGGQFRRPLRIT